MTDEDFDDLDDLPDEPRGPGISPEDYELLCLAALAIGCEDVEVIEGEQWVNLHFPDRPSIHNWNPKRHGDDALELAVKLNLHISPDFESAGCVTIEWDFGDSTTPAGTLEERSPESGGDLAATRLAITRAAAEIGKALG
jgi:hypothetical protein